jgi:GNAT superfamily N-acetyltransferase
METPAKHQDKITALLKGICEDLALARKHGRQISRWHYIDIGQFYVRAGMYYPPTKSERGESIVLSNIGLYPEYQGAGIFREILKQIEELCDARRLALVAENVLGPEFTAMLRRRADYEEILFYGNTSFYREPK